MLTAKKNKALRASYEVASETQCARPWHAASAASVAMPAGEAQVATRACTRLQNDDGYGRGSQPISVAAICSRDHARQGSRRRLSLPSKPHPHPALRRRLHLRRRLATLPAPPECFHVALRLGQSSICRLTSGGDDEGADGYCTLSSAQPRAARRLPGPRARVGIRVGTETGGALALVWLGRADSMDQAEWGSTVCWGRATRGEQTREVPTRTEGGTHAWRATSSASQPTHLPLPSHVPFAHQARL